MVVIDDGFSYSACIRKQLRMWSMRAVLINALQQVGSIKAVLADPSQGKSVHLSTTFSGLIVNFYVERSSSFGYIIIGSTERVMPVPLFVPRLYFEYS